MMRFAKFVYAAMPAAWTAVCGPGPALEVFVAEVRSEFAFAESMAGRDFGLHFLRGASVIQS